MVSTALPVSVLAPIRQAIRDREEDSAVPHPDPAEASRQAFRLPYDHEGSGELRALASAIELFREAVAASCPCTPQDTTPTSPGKTLTGPPGPAPYWTG